MAVVGLLLLVHIYYQFNNIIVFHLLVNKANALIQKA